MSAVLADPLLSRAASVPIVSPTASWTRPRPDRSHERYDPRRPRARRSRPRTSSRHWSSAPSEGHRRARDRSCWRRRTEWATDATGARALLDAVDVLLDSGRLRPRPLAAVVEAGPPAAGAAAAPGRPAPGQRPRDPDRRRRLGSGTEHRQSRTCARLLYPGSDVGRRRSTPCSPRWNRPCCARLGGVARPPGRSRGALPRTPGRGSASCATRCACWTRPSPYSLGTSDAPLLVTVANGLPVTMEVRLSISSTAGLRVAPIAPQRIPPLGRRQVQVSAEVMRSGQFAVRRRCGPRPGALLGPPSRLRVRSTAYGTITLWLTGCAGVLLVVLAVRAGRAPDPRRAGPIPQAGPAPAAATPDDSTRPGRLPTDPEPRDPPGPLPARTPTPAAPAPTPARRASRAAGPRPTARPTDLRTAAGARARDRP